MADTVLFCGLTMNQHEFKEKVKVYYNEIANERDRWKKKNWYYYREIERYCKFIIPNDCSVLEIGCGTGDLLAAVKPSRGLGLDISENMIKVSQCKYPTLEFRICDAEILDIEEKFDYVILSDLVGSLFDIQHTFYNLRKVTKPETRIIITHYNYFWEPILKLGERLGLKMKQPIQNWFSISDTENMLYLHGYEVVKKGCKLPLPIYIPIFSNIVNRFAANLPMIRKLGLIQLIVAKEIVMQRNNKDYTCSVIIPCRNEFGNIKGVITRIPAMGKHTELIFIDGCSTDNTVDEIQRLMKIYSDKDIKLIRQGVVNGKGDAVRKGFAAASGDVLMILDADLTVPPEYLPKFFSALVEGKGEFINGSRLVYQKEKMSMRFLNLIGNKFFSLLFSYLLDQRFKDTLCGTKVLFKRDYEKIKAGRSFFGEFDPFGDFDLIFGATKLNLKIVEIPIRYHERKYGETNISRFRHGLLLLKMSLIAMMRLKFI